MRIVTLLPSATEIVCALGLGDKLVGVSHSCNYPPHVRNIPRVTRTNVPSAAASDVIDEFVRGHLTQHTALYELDMVALREAAPDFIVSQGLCDVCAVSTGDVLAALDLLPSRPKLIDLTPNTLDDVLNDCARVGNELGQKDSAARLLGHMLRQCEIIGERSAEIPVERRPRVAFLEWLMPPFNGGHWNPELVHLAGGIDLFGKPGKPSTGMTWDHVLAGKPERLVIACCGFSKERALEDIKHLQDCEIWRQLPAVVDGNVFVADGDAYFSRPGPRLLDGLQLMAHWFHPNVHPAAGLRT